jgi:hypothetical protein
MKSKMDYLIENAAETVNAIECPEQSPVRTKIKSAGRNDGEDDRTQMLYQLHTKKIKKYLFKQ